MLVSVAWKMVGACWEGLKKGKVKNLSESQVQTFRQNAQDSTITVHIHATLTLAAVKD